MESTRGVTKRFLTSVQEFKDLISLGIPVYDVDFKESDPWTRLPFNLHHLQEYINKRDLYIYVE
jgi:hypothetical protein